MGGAPFGCCWNKLGVPFFRSPNSPFLERCPGGKETQESLGGSPIVFFGQIGVKEIGWLLRMNPFQSKDESYFCQ